MKQSFSENKFFWKTKLLRKHIFNASTRYFYYVTGLDLHKRKSQKIIGNM